MNENSGPNYEQISTLLTLFQTQEFDAALDLASFIVSLFPEHQLSWKVLAGALQKLGRGEDALVAGTEAVRLLPTDAEAQNNLGVVLADLDKFEEAIAHYAIAINQEPEYLDAHNNLGVALEQLGKRVDAETSFKRAIALNSRYAKAHSNLGKTLNALGRSDEAIKSLTQALAIDPNLSEARINLNTVLSSAVPAWHFPMMNDQARNKSYADAINLAVEDGSFVVEIGTGSGLLAMMAVKAGAGRVLACESSKTIAEAARQVISANGLEKKNSSSRQKIYRPASGRGPFQEGRRCHFRSIVC
jgi:type II protein arginine methyltransferase